MKKLFLLLLMVATVGVAMAQTRTISGTVTYAGDGEPLLGATVMPIGGGQGTSTNVEGKFNIIVPANVKKIRVSYVGMHTQEVAAGTDLKIVMQNSDKSLDEVMVVAYGTAKKSAFTGSAAVIDASEIEQAQVSNALSAITGKVPGVQIMTNSGQPGSGPTQIRIRGISSINAGNSPLVVVDGSPFAGDVNQINTNDIASMTVLKDAAANALYGARGANGVILITTKKGQNAGATVTLDAKWGVNTRATQDYNMITDPRQYYEVYYDALKNKFISDGMSPYQAWQAANANLIDSNTYGLGYQVMSYPSNEAFIGRDGKVNPNAVYGNVVNGYYLRPDNWLDETYESSLRQEYNLSVSNNSDLTTFYASAGYLKNEGIIPNSSFERFSGRLSADTQAKPWLKVGATMAYSHFDINSMAGDGDGASTVNPLAFATSVAPIYPMYLRDAAGNKMRNDDGLLIYDLGNGENGGMKRPSGAAPGSNGLMSAMYDTNNSEGNTFNGNAYADIRFLKDFKFTTNNSVYLQESRGTSVANPYFGASAAQDGSVGKSHTRYLQWTYQQFLTWQHLFGKHDVNVMLGHESNWERTYTLSASKSGMFSPDNHELAGAVVDGSMNSYTSEYNNEGWLGRVQYDYDTKYFASASYRRDGSSRFHPDHRWGNFWSVGAAWLINKEEWFSAPWVDMLKFKVSYGEQGNDNLPSSYLWTNNYAIVNDGGKPAVMAGPVMGNPDITWEKNGNFNIGVEFDLFGSRLGGNIEGFYRKTTDMLYQRGLPVSMGYTNQWMNFGDMMNAGIEVDIHGSIFRTRDFTWDVNLNLTYVKNEVTRLPEESISRHVEGYWGQASAGYYTGEGLPLYTWYCLDYAGVDPATGRALYWKDVYKTKEVNGKKQAIMGDDGEYIVDHREKVPLTDEPTQYLNGSAMAPVYGGFGTSFTYKGFDLSIDFAYQIGGKVMDSAYQSLMSSPQSAFRGTAIHADVLNSWTPENPGSNIPRWQFGDEENQASNRFLTDASYLSLQNINFGYSLPASLISKLHLQKLRFYVSADNVWLWSQRQGLDPRQSISGSNSNAFYSPIRTISGGLTVVF